VATADEGDGHALVSLLIDPRSARQCYASGAGDNVSRLLVFHGDLSRSTFLLGFWRWVELLAANDNQGATEALWWSGQAPDPEAFTERYRTFWGRNRLWHAVVPNKRLVGVVNEAAEVEFEHFSRWDPAHVGWGLAQVPVTPTPAEAKSDTVELMGVATSFFLRQHADGLVLEFEIIHV
jgi:hypothetical protein